MYEFIVGKVLKKGLDYIVIENNEIGYRVSVSENTAKKFVVGEKVKVLLELVVREDAFLLYGFYNEDEREIFRKLTTVSGIGPKVAIGILSGMEVDALINAIVNSDVKSLMKAPGVGKKTAERIVVELKDKFKNIEIKDVPEVLNSVSDDAISALVALGYTQYEATDKVLEIYDGKMSLEDLIRVSLKELVR